MRKYIKRWLSLLLCMGVLYSSVPGALSVRSYADEAPDAHIEDSLAALRSTIDALPDMAALAQMDQESEEFSQAYFAVGDFEARLSATTDGMSEADAAAFREHIGAERMEKYTALCDYFAALSGPVAPYAAYPSLDSDLVHITDFKVTDIIDGIAPFDGDSTPGNDAANANRVVRTFDDITYTLSATTTPWNSGDVFHAAKAKFEFVLPCTSDQAEFDTAAMGWMLTGGIYQWAVTTEMRMVDGVNSSCQVLTCWRDIPSNEETHIAVPGTFTVDVTVKVKGMKNGDIVKPIFNAAMEHNTWDGDCAAHHAAEKQTVIADPVIVSAAPKYNIKISGKDDIPGAYDFSTGTAGVAHNQSVGLIYGRLSKVAVIFQLYNENASKGLKGIELPTGPVTLHLTLESVYNKTGGGTESAAAYQPLLWGLAETKPTTFAMTGGKPPPQMTAA